MHNLALALSGSWKVLVAGLLLGAGLPTLFAVGVRSLAHAATGSAAGPASGPVSSMASGARAAAVRSLGILCFAVVVLAVLLGLTYIVASGFGMTVTFGGGFPTLGSKH